MVISPALLDPFFPAPDLKIEPTFCLHSYAEVD